MIDTLIIPGLNGSSSEHWLRHWARDHTQAVVVEQDDWPCLVLGDWQAKLDEALSATDSASLVAHSLGCLLVARYAQRRLAAKIRAAGPLQRGAPRLDLDCHSSRARDCQLVISGSLDAEAELQCDLCE
jgi:predicted alpha/beta hydrolase family esterase